MAIGNVEAVMNPTTQIYRWAADNIASGLKDDLLDFAMTHSDDMRIPIEGYCYRCKDRDLGERVRHEVLGINNLETGSKNSFGMTTPRM
jgi:hypothetical protein